MMREKNARLHIRMTDEQKEFIERKAEEMGFNSVSSFMIDSAKTYFRVDIDMSAYTKLAIQVNYIGKNINNLTRKIFSDKLYTDSDLDMLLENQERIDKLISNEFSRLADVRKSTNSNECSPKDLIRVVTQFEQNNLKVPDKYLYEEVYQAMRDDFLYLIDLMEKSPEEFKEEADFLAEILYSGIILEIPKKAVIACSDEFFQFAENLKFKIAIVDGYFDERDWFELRELLEKYHIYEIE